MRGKHVALVNSHVERDLILKSKVPVFFGRDDLSVQSSPDFFSKGVHVRKADDEIDWSTEGVCARAGTGALTMNAFLSCLKCFKGHLRVTLFLL